MIAQRWLIEGRVQGVGYRMWLRGEARALGITGWVRNLMDGRVEAVLQGTVEGLASLRQAAGRGPDLAVVRGVTAQEWAGPMPNGPFSAVADTAS